MQYTIRNIPPELDRRLRERARTEGRSLNEVVINALIRGLGEVEVVHRDLSDIADTWQRGAEADRALAEQRCIDQQLWR